MLIALIKVYLLIGVVFFSCFCIGIFRQEGTLSDKLKVLLMFVPLFALWPIALIGLLFIKDDTDDHF